MSNITGLIVAMNQEAALIQGAMTDLKEEKRGHLTFYRGRLQDKEVVLHVCGIGKVSAAIGCVEMINAYHPASIVNSGVAGGLSKDVQRGDFVISRAICYHDVWCGEGCEKGQIQGLPAVFTTPECWQKIVEPLVAESRANSEHRVAADDRAATETPRLHFGLIASGDRFITSSAEVNAIHANFPEALAVDMESGSLAQTCHLYNIPFICCRIISDTPASAADAAEHFAQYNDFWNIAPQRSAAFLTRLLNRLV